MTRQYSLLFIRLGKRALERALAFAISHPKLKSYIIAVLRKLKLYSSIRATFMCMIAVQSFETNANDEYCFPCADIANIQPRARQIYAELKSAIERSQKERS